MFHFFNFDSLFIYSVINFWKKTSLFLLRINQCHFDLQWWAPKNMGPICHGLLSTEYKWHWLKLHNDSHVETRQKTEIIQYDLSIYQTAVCKNIAILQLRRHEVPTLSHYSYKNTANNNSIFPSSTHKKYDYYIQLYN